MTKRSFSFANNPLMQGPALDERARGGVPYREIPLSAIEADPNQPRQNFDQDKLQELADSIRLYGVLSPILVKSGNLPGRYVIISGERRFRASYLAGQSSIPAIVNQAEEADGKKLAIQLVENLQRSDLSPLERAHAIAALRDGHSLSVRDIADKLSISKSAVQRSLDILQLPHDLLNALREGVAESKVLLLAKVQDESERAKYLSEIDTLTRSQLEQSLGKREPKNDPDPAEAKEASAEDLRISDEIQRSLGMKVRLARNTSNTDNGKLSIEFYGDGDLQILFRKLVAE
jgi:ParB family chromosome partitioning protein